MTVQDALKRRLSGQQDSRSTQGILSRGANVYNGGTPNAHSGGFGATSSNSVPKTQAFAHDPELAAIRRRIEGQRAQLRSGYDLSRSRARQDMQKQRRDLGKWHENALTHNTERMADQGILRSGINIDQQQKIGEQRNEQSQALEQGFARQMDDMRRQLSEQMQGFRNALEDLKFEQARREEERQLREAEQAARAKANSTGSYPLNSGNTSGTRSYLPAPQTAVARRLGV